MAPMVNTVTNRYVKGKETTNAIFASMETSLPQDFTLNYGVRYTWVDSKLSKAVGVKNGYAPGTKYNNAPDDKVGQVGSDKIAVLSLT